MEAVLLGHGQHHQHAHLVKQQEQEDVVRVLHLFTMKSLDKMLKNIDQ
jgi:hypothetical protein